MLERDSPLPTRLARRGSSQRVDGSGAGARHGHRAVTRQPMAPVLVSGLQRLLDEEAAEARAVDEEIGLDDLPVLQGYGGNVAALMHADVDDFAFGASYPLLPPHHPHTPATHP